MLFISPQVYRPDEPAYEDLNSLVQQAQRRLQPLSHEQIVVVDNFYNDHIRFEDLQCRCRNGGITCQAHG